MDELIKTLEAFREEMRTGFEKIYNRIENVERVTATTYDDVQELRKHAIEQLNRTGQRITQVENVAQDLTKSLARTAGANGS